MVLGEDHWVCGSCRSINSRRSDHCYQCHAPRHVVEVDPHDIPGTGHPIKAPPAPLGAYRSARQRAMVASGLILAASLVSLVGWIAQSRAILAAIDAPEVAPSDDPAAVTALAFDAVIPVSHLQVPLTVLWVVLAIAALTAWAAWLSRVVDNLPSLGLGYARVSPQMAFIENFLMGRNLYSMPARVREVTQKLHPAGGGDEILAVAWLALFGSVVGGRFGFYVARFLAGSEDEYLRARIVVGGLTTVVALAGYVLVVAVIQRVERLAEARATGVTAELAGGATGGAGVTAATSGGPASAFDRAPSSHQASDPEAATTRAAPGADAPAEGAGPSPAAGVGPSPAPAVIRPASGFAAGRTVEFLSQRASTASPGTLTGTKSSPGTPAPSSGTPPTPGAAGEPGSADPSPDDPRRST
jgi:hypothetical protein